MVTIFQFKYIFVPYEFCIGFLKRIDNINFISLVIVTDTLYSVIITRMFGK